LLAWEVAVVICSLCGTARVGLRAIPWALLSSRARRRWRLERDAGLREGCDDCVRDLIAIKDRS
jgi:hypothetical protein